MYCMPLYVYQCFLSLWGLVHVCVFKKPTFLTFKCLSTIIFLMRREIDFTVYALHDIWMINLCLFRDIYLTFICIFFGFNFNKCYITSRQPKYNFHSFSSKCNDDDNKKCNRERFGNTFIYSFRQSVLRIKCLKLVLFLFIF